MPFNEIAPAPVVRRPRMRILVDGVPLRGGVEAQVVTNGNREADSFSATLALGYDPNFNIGYWGREKKVPVEVQYGLLPDGAPEGQVPWQSMFTGTADHIQISLNASAIVLSGRDLSSRFIDEKTREVFPNQTASDVIKTLAERRGMTADVTPTTTPVGAYYKDQHDKISLDSSANSQNEWQLMRGLATQEGYDLWVSGTTVHFHPYVEPDKADPFIALWNLPGVTSIYPTSNVVNLELERSLALAKDIRVVVKTWSSRNAASAQFKAGSSSKNAQEYVIVKPGQTPAQAQALANQLLREITLHERVIGFDMPGELRMDNRTILRLQGTQSDWDAQTYYVDTITRSISVDKGFTQNVRAKNTSPRAQAASG